MRQLVKLFLMLCLCSLSHFGKSQYNFPWPWYTYLGFEDTLNYSHLSFDSISNPNNIWQIGDPQKNVFNYCHGQRAIMTDTANSYPINDTSSFIIEHLVQEGFMQEGNLATIEGWYYVDCDSLNDYGKIELSVNHGLSWVLISDDTLSFIPLGSSVPQNWPFGFFPTLTGTNSWYKSFSIDLYNIGYIFNLNYGDTILFRFTFISDGIAESRDGLMFDFIEILDGVFWGIEENQLQTFNVFPNPASLEIQIQNLKNPIETIKIYSMDGRLVYAQSNPYQNKIPIEFLERGTYQILAETNDGNFLTSRFIKI